MPIFNSLDPDPHGGWSGSWILILIRLKHIWKSWYLEPTVLHISRTGCTQSQQYSTVHIPNNSTVQCTYPEQAVRRATQFTLGFNPVLRRPNSHSVWNPVLRRRVCQKMPGIVSWFHLNRKILLYLGLSVLLIVMNYANRAPGTTDSGDRLRGTCDYPYVRVYSTVLYLYVTWKCEFCPGPAECPRCSSAARCHARRGRPTYVHTEYIKIK